MSEKSVYRNGNNADSIKLAHAIPWNASDDDLLFLKQIGLRWVRLEYGSHGPDLDHMSSTQKRFASSRAWMLGRRNLFGARRWILSEVLAGRVLRVSGPHGQFPPAPPRTGLPRISARCLRNKVAYLYFEARIPGKQMSGETTRRSNVEIFYRQYPTLRVAGNSSPGLHRLPRSGVGSAGR